MSDVMWCENCRMRLGIDVDCDIAGHVHRPLRPAVADHLSSMPTWERLLIWAFFAWIAVGVLAMAQARPEPVERPVPPTVVTTGGTND